MESLDIVNVSFDAEKFSTSQARNWQKRHGLSPKKKGVRYNGRLNYVQSEGNNHESHQIKLRDGAIQLHVGNSTT